MDIVIFAVLGAVIALVFAAVKTRRIMKSEDGNDRIKKIASAIKRGANAYLKRQYRTVGIFFIVITAVLAVLRHSVSCRFLCPSPLS